MRIELPQRATRQKQDKRDDKSARLAGVARQHRTDQVKFCATTQGNMPGIPCCEPMEEGMIRARHTTE
eukprot:1360735-Amorphochlora_amoeboformis.AAC.1